MPSAIQGPASWLELSTERTLHNLAGVRALVGERRVMAVLKSNAYGAGAAGMAKVLAAAGVDAFGVGSVAEGVALRQGGIRSEVFCLTYFTEDEIATIVDQELTPLLSRLEEAELLSRRAQAAGRRQQAWIKVDTGLGRLGVPWQQAAALVGQVRAMPHLVIRGLLSTLTESPERDPVQVLRLRAVREQAEAGAGPQAGLALSFASSNGILSQPESYLDLVRPGIMLLGWEPSERSRLDQERVQRADLQPVATWKCRVVRVETVAQGEQVGYGRRPALAQDTRVATLAAGWATGYPAALAGHGQVLLEGRRCPVLAVSAHTVLVDVAAAPVQVNDEAVLLGRQGPEEITGEALVQAGGQSVYHLLAGVPGDVPRLWR